MLSAPLWDSEASAPATETPEAIVARAKSQYDAAMHFVPPVYDGDGSFASVDGFIQGAFGPWAKQRAALNEEMEATYAKLSSAKPSASSSNLVDASRYIAYSWGNLAAEYWAPGMPRAWSDPKTRNSYSSLRESFYEQMGRAAEPYRERAVAAFKKCHDDAERLGPTDLSRDCDNWLGLHKSLPQWKDLIH